MVHRGPRNIRKGKDGIRMDDRPAGHLAFTLVKSTLDEGDYQNGSEMPKEFT